MRAPRGPRSEESKAKQSASSKGVPKSPEHKEKLRKALAKARAVRWGNPLPME